MQSDPNYPSPGKVGIIFGGPPCQVYFFGRFQSNYYMEGFSKMNSKRHEDNPLLDPRNRLMKVYLNYVRYFRRVFLLLIAICNNGYIRPAYCLLENVLGLLELDEGSTIRMIFKVLVLLGYQVIIFILCMIIFY
jgi:site-specific DNA-cytosine methylase